MLIERMEKAPSRPYDGWDGAFWCTGQKVMVREGAVKEEKVAVASFK